MMTYPCPRTDLELQYAAEIMRLRHALSLIVDLASHDGTFAEAIDIAVSAMIAPVARARPLPADAQLDAAVAAIRSPAPGLAV